MRQCRASTHWVAIAFVAACAAVSRGAAASGLGAVAEASFPGYAHAERRLQQTDPHQSAHSINGTVSGDAADSHSTTDRTQEAAADARLGAPAAAGAAADQAAAAKGSPERGEPLSASARGLPAHNTIGKPPSAPESATQRAAERPPQVAAASPAWPLLLMLINTTMVWWSVKRSALG